MRWRESDDAGSRLCTWATLLANILHAEKRHEQLIAAVAFGWLMALVFWGDGMDKFDGALAEFGTGVRDLSGDRAAVEAREEREDGRQRQRVGEGGTDC